MAITNIDNIPFFAPNISYHDIISVENDNGVLYFDELISTSGHTTLQIIFFKNDKINDVLNELEIFKCSWEGLKGKPYFAIDVPPNVNYNEVKSFLKKECEMGVLDYKESCLAH